MTAIVCPSCGGWVGDDPDVKPTDTDDITGAPIACDNRDCLACTIEKKWEGEE